MAQRKRQAKPEVHVSPTGRKSDESETLGTIEPIIPEKPSVTTEENGTTETAERPTRSSCVANKRNYYN